LRLKKLSLRKETELMKYYLPLLAIALSTLAAPSVAQSKFEGFYGQVAVGYESISPTLTNTPISVSGSSSTIPLATSISSTSGGTGNVALGYTASLNKDYTLGIGAEYYPIDSSTDNYTSTLAGRTSTGTYQKQNAYNIFIAPGMNVGTDGLAYFKVGYTGASVKSSQGSVSSTENLSGYSLGLGYKQFFAGNWYGFGEANYFSYGNSVDNQRATAGTRTLSWSTTLNANVYNLLVGVGYKF
jgi:hypothetical protein